MDAEQIIAAAKKYGKIFEKHSVGKRKHPTDKLMISKQASRENSHWMLDEIQAGLKLKKNRSQENIEKYRGWLCWVQNEIFHAGWGTIDDFRDDNRPKEKTT